MSGNNLNKLQIKAEVLTVLSKLQAMPEVSDTESLMEVLSAQSDKKAILDVLIKELLKSTEQRAILICYMLLRLCQKEILEPALWDILKSAYVSDIIKSMVMNLLRDLGNRVNYEKIGEYFENPDEIIDADTKKLLHVAIVNPEAQIDFLDFLKSLPESDKKILVKSLGEDYSQDSLANILIPLFLYAPESDLGKIASDILGETKSQLALHALIEALEFVEDAETVSSIRKNISTLKIAGVREDNAIEFYKQILSSSSPYESYISYPDGHGNQAVIFSRIKENETVQMFAVVINSLWGIIDCFGFNEISKAEFERIVQRFFDGDEHTKVPPSFVKYVLKNAQNITRKTGGEISYEYLCWKTLLSDIEDGENFENILAENFVKKKLSDNEMEKFYFASFVQRWFLDTEYSQEFKQFVETLNLKFMENDFDIDLEAAVKENFKIIFSDAERKNIEERLLMCAYLEFLAKDLIDAQILYALSFDEENKIKLYENILRKSIYEYYVLQKFKQKEERKTANIFTLRNKKKEKELSSQQVEKIISIIENLWVCENV